MRPKELLIRIDVSDLSLIEAESLWGIKDVRLLVFELMQKPPRGASNIIVCSDEEN